MIDLIIPYYDNPDGLLQTLESIDKNIFYITIIDDHSSKFMPFSPTANQIFRTNINRGPGCARQLGIDKTNNDYFMFIDTGDIFLSKEIQREIVQNIILNPRAEVISFPYYYKNMITKEPDNRMHGKIYKRSFIKKNQITFCPESSYMNEDIGFNRACRLFTNIEFINIPIIKWIENENSLTQKGDHIALYRDQTRALSLVMIHALNICEENNINIHDEINKIVISLYYWFIRTAAERSEFMQNAWSGVKIFYDYFKNQIKPNELIYGNNLLNQCLRYKTKVNFQINILRFVHDIYNFTLVPERYIKT